MTDKELVTRHIANILDHPSVYMGGPSANSLRKAERIVKYLEDSKRLKDSECTHEGYVNYKLHGTYCPICGQNFKKEEETKHD